MPATLKTLPWINFAIATAALSFQVGVLYPWHNQLDHDFREMKRENEAKLKEYHSLKLERLEHIEAKLTTLLDLINGSKKPATPALIAAANAN